MVAAVKYVCSCSKYVVEFCNGGGAQKCPYQMVKNFFFTTQYHNVTNEETEFIQASSGRDRPLCRLCRQRHLSNMF